MSKRLEKCKCEEILNRARIAIHLTGCPESSYAKEYKEMSWWKRRFHNSPEKIYNWYLRV